MGQRRSDHPAVDDRHHVHLAQPDRLLGGQAPHPGPQSPRAVLQARPLHGAEKTPFGKRPPDEQGFDASLNYDGTIPRWRFELMRLGAWFIGFQVSFFFLLVVPLVVMRAVT